MSSLLLIILIPWQLEGNATGTTSDFSFGGVGDWSCNSVASQTASNIDNRGMDVVLGLGDYSYQTTADCWFTVTEAIDENLHIAIGNHDDISSTLLDQYMSHFGLSDQFYSFNYRDIHFLSISTELAIDPSSEQYDFVANDLDQASQNASVNWIVAFMHKPMYTSPTNHPASAEFRNALHPLFDQYNVDLVFQAHNHNYQRTYPLSFNPNNPAVPVVSSAEKTSYTNPSAPIFVLVGTGGHSSYPLNGQANYVIKQFTNVPGFLGFNVTNSGKTLQGAFFANIDNGAGHIRDSFSITKDPDAWAQPLRKADFNGDGFADLAVGVPGEDFGTTMDVGAVNVIYGSSTGLSATTPKADQFWHQDVPSVEGGNEAGDNFGAILGTGDFNNDGFSDLAIGAPGEDLGSSANGGSVTVIYGSSSGLGATGASDGTGRADQFWSQDSSGVDDFTEPNDQFGASLTTGDFNKDGYDDLAIGVALEDFGTAIDSGAVNVIYGSSSGLSATTIPDQFWRQDSTNIEDVSETGDHFGNSLSAGDFNNDGYSDLAIGAADEDLSSFVDAGAVNIIYGSPTGLSAQIVLDQLWQQNSPSVEGDAANNDRFGSVLTASDFNGDGYGDLAVGVPNERNGTANSFGVVNVLYGSTGGLSATTAASGIGRDNQLWYQDSPNIEGTAADNDNFGYSLGAGDFNGDGYGDIAIGVVGDEVSTTLMAGSVNIIYGSPTGLVDAGNQLWAQDSAGIKGTSEVGNKFGFSLAINDFNNDGNSDIAIGVPAENYDDLNDEVLSNVGAINIIYGSSTGLTSTGNQFWQQDSVSVEDIAEQGDQLGSALG